MIGANQSLSKIFANLIYFFLVFFGIITAVEILGLDRLTIILNEILEVTGQIIFGLIILAIGNYISLLIYNTMTRSSNNTFIAGIMRWASLALFIAIALRTMGIANEIVELAFGLILGALAVAVALSYGLGGREAAGEHFKDIIGKLRSEAADIPAEDTPDLSGDRPFSSTSGRNFGSENPPAGTSYGTNNPGVRPENTGTGNSGNNPGGNKTTNPGGPGSGPEEHKRFDSGASAQPGRQENPNRPQRGPENPNPPSRGPENPGRPDRGPQNPDSPNRGPENPDRPTRGPEDPGRL